MKKRFERIVFLALLTLCVTGMSAFGDVLISDDFDRANSPIALGKTDQGDSWMRRDMSSNDGSYAPGIYNNTLQWGASSFGEDAAYLGEGTDVKDFVLDFDYIKVGAPSAHLFSLNFRMASIGTMVTDGGASGGYVLYLALDGSENLSLTMVDDYGMSQNVDVAVTGSTNHITLVADGNGFDVYVNDASQSGSPAMSVVDSSVNPSKDAAGYFTMVNNQWASAAIDNFVVAEIPEPATIGLLAVGGFLGLFSRRKK